MANHTIFSIGKDLTPTAAVNNDLTPTANVDNNQTPTSMADDNLTPTSAMDNNVAPTSTVDNNLTPTSAVDYNVAPTSTVDNNRTPTSAVDYNVAPTATVDNNRTPTSDDNLTPTSAVDNNLTSSPTLSPTFRISARPRVYVVRRANLAAAHNLLEDNPPSADPNSSKTRQRTSAFPFLRLPPELRNQIYALALRNRAPTTTFSKFRVPALMHASRQLRREAIGFALAGTRTRVDVRSPFRVPAIDHLLRRGRPAAEPRLYAEAGDVAASAERVALAEREGLLFEDLEIGVLCYCCEKVRVGTFFISLRAGSRCEVRGQNCWKRNPELNRALVMMEKAIKRVVANVEAREGFVGFTFEDLLEIAECMDPGKWL